MPRKQLDIPGTEPITIREIEDAADKYVTIRDKRMKMTEQEIVAKAALVQAVLDHVDELAADAEGNKTYRFDDLLVVMTNGKPNVKVKTAHDDEADGEAD